MDDLPAIHFFFPALVAALRGDITTAKRMIDANAAYTVGPSYTAESAASLKPERSFYSCSTMVSSVTSVDPMEYPTLSINAVEDSALLRDIEDKSRWFSCLISSFFCLGH